MIPCHDHRGDKWWFCNPTDVPRRKTLPVDIQKDFLNKEFVTFEYTNLSPKQEEDLFARVQMGVPLSAAEKMRASTGPWQELARYYVDDFPTIYSLLKDRSRGKDFQLTLACFSQIVEVQHPTAADGIPAMKTSHTALPALLRNKAAVDDDLKSHFSGVWNKLQNLIEFDPDTFTNADRRLQGVQTFAPIEMVAVTVLISVHSKNRNNRLLLGDIRALRDALRENLGELRMNPQTWKVVWHFIENLESYRGAVDGTTVNRSVSASPTPQFSGPVSETSASRLARDERPNVAKHLSGPSPGRRLRIARVESPNSGLYCGNIKRQRIDPGPGGTNLNALLTSSSTAVTNVPTSQPRRQSGYSRADPVILDKSPTPAPFIPNAQPVNPESTRRTIQGPPEEQPQDRQGKGGPSGPAIAPRAEQQVRTTLMTPPQARQNRISEINSYRGPFGLAESSVPSAPTRSTVRTLQASTGWSDLSTVPMDFAPNSWVSLPTRTTPPPARGEIGSSSFARTIPTQVRSFQGPSKSPFSASGPIRPPSHSREIILTVSPEQPKARVPPARPVPPGPKDVARPLSQIDGAIDLPDDVEEEWTSEKAQERRISMKPEPVPDTEQERQALLAAFQAHGPAQRKPPGRGPSLPSSKPRRTTSRVSVINTFKTPLRQPVVRRPIVVEDSTEEDSGEDIVPYQ